MELNAFFPYRLAIAAEGFSRNLSEVYGAQFGLTREEWRLLFLLAEAGNWIPTVLVSVPPLIRCRSVVLPSGSKLKI